MRAWANDEWTYVGVLVRVLDADDDEVEAESLWGVESDGDYWRECAADMINGIIEGRVEASYAAESEAGESQASEVQQ